VAEQNNVSSRFFIGRKNAVSISVEKTNHGVVGSLPAAVFENADVCSLGNGLPNAFCQLDRAVVGVVVTHKTAHETDDNVVGRR
jgi:hypothetical protein